MGTTKTWPISRKMWILTGFLLVNLSAIGYLAWSSPRHLIAKVSELATVQLPAVRLMSLTDMMHDGIRAIVYSGILAADGYKVGEMKEIQAELAEFSKNIRDDMTELTKLQLSAEIKAGIADSMPEVETYVTNANGIIDLIVKGKKSEAITQLPSFMEGFESLEKKLGVLGELIEKSAADSSAAGVKLGNDTETLNLILTSFGWLAGLAASFYLIQQLSRQLRILTDLLTKEAERQSQASQHIRESAQHLSSATNEQAAAIEESVASMEQMASMLNQTTQNADHSRIVCEQGQTNAKQGQQVIEKMTVAMDDIRANNDKLESLVNLINDIQSKTKIINDIVFETRLLSFNASIEAARAGVHGKGFAVVAEEVGKLAAMSGKSADEIRFLLENSTKQVSNIVRSSQERVNIGKAVSEECAVAFNSMGSTLSNISTAVTNIVAATKEQEVGVKQTNTAMAEMDRLVQKNSASAADLSSQAEKLGKSGVSLNEAVTGMRRLVFGGTRSMSPLQVLETTTHQPSESATAQVPKDTKISAPPSSETDLSVVGKNKPKRDDSAWKKSA